MSSKNLVAVDGQNYDEAVAKSEVPVVVDFWAEWCGPCRAVAPSFAELASELDGQVKFAKVNVDEAGDIAQRFGIQSIPAFVVLQGGKEIHRFTGARPKEDLRAQITGALRSQVNHGGAESASGKRQ